MKNKFNVSFIVAALVAALAGYVIYNSKPAKQIVIDLSDARPTSVFSDSIPRNGETLIVIPKEVMLRFSSPIAAPSHFHIQFMGERPVIDLTENNGEEYRDGDTILTADGLSMSAKMKTDNVPNGVYRVKYKTCTDEYDCEIGNFFFRVSVKL